MSKEDLTKRLGVDIDAGTLRLALTHRSYAYEQGGIPTNERLEFLGDSVLGLSVTDALYRDNPELSEGDLAKRRSAVVSTRALAGVARSLGIPVVFTLAPDPHAVVHALDMAGALTRENFGAADEREHYWFRARLVQRLAAESAHAVLFPRPELRHDLRELLGIDVEQEPHRYTVIPEGIDLAVSETAAREATRGVASPACDELDALIAALPAHRRGLPLAVSAGRLHPIKGMATVVAAWAGDPALRRRCNLLVVGGDLADPSPQERSELDLIAATLAADPVAADGLLLPGHRPNDVVVRWLAAAAGGRPPLLGAGGVYVCGSLKEEFGLALLEALAAGLVVVAPAGGGPATYVEEGTTGFLVDTTDPAALARGMHQALDRAGRPDSASRAARARGLVRDRFTVQAMATALAGVYARALEPEDAVGAPAGEP